MRLVCLVLSSPIRNVLAAYIGAILQKLTFTGWPTDGSNYENASPGVSTAETFWKQGICGALKWDVNIFAFEAFDEPWKPKSVGTDGSVADETHWGVFDADRNVKYDTSC